MKYYPADIEERIGYDFYADIAEQLVKARKKKGWTQQELAKTLKWEVTKIARIELVQIRTNLHDLEALAKALDVTLNWLIVADIDSQIGDCLYIVWSERVESWKLYMKATSKRLAFLKVQDAVEKCLARFLDPRDRARVRLVGIPHTANEIRDKFPGKVSDQEELELDKPVERR